MALTKVDFRILSILQTEGRLPVAKIAERVGMSASACSRRIDQLERSQTIEYYEAVISNEALGQTLLAIVHITLDHQSEKSLETFEKAVTRCPFIEACFLMSGEYDYILRVSARDMRQFETIHKDWLTALPGVQRIHSSFAMRTVVNRANIDIASLQNP